MGIEQKHYEHNSVYTQHPTFFVLTVLVQLTL